MFYITRVVIEKGNEKRNTWVNARYAYLGHRLTLIQKRPVFMGLKEERTINKDWVVTQILGPSIGVEEIYERKDY